MIEFEEASSLIFDAANPLGEMAKPIEDAVSYVLSRDIISPLSISPFRNSAMDGFAVRAEWLERCSPDNPIKLPIDTTVFAGDSGSAKISENRPIRIMTGAPVPDKFDTVVKFEDTVYDDAHVVFAKPITQGKNIRPAGEDIHKDQLVLKRGHLLTPLDIGILAGIGLKEVSVFKKPSVLVFSNGNELVSPGEKLKFGQIYDSNKYTVSSLIKPFVERIEIGPTVIDESEKLEQALSADFDVIITSGGVSAGEKDLVIGAANKIGFEQVFHKARIKPGKPIFFAKKSQRLLFGLPGNPLSTAVTCAVFVIPVLKKLIGRDDYEIRAENAVINPEQIRPGGRLLIWPGKFRRTRSGITAEYSEKKSSAALSALLNSDGLIFSDLSGNNVPASTQVQVIFWNQLLS
ncbi:MAG: molybdopterin molybdotransferase MoeA [candidate division Zixibacteria bacterium]